MTPTPSKRYADPVKLSDDPRIVSPLLSIRHVRIEHSAFLSLAHALHDLHQQAQDEGVAEEALDTISCFVLADGRLTVGYLVETDATSYRRYEVDALDAIDWIWTSTPGSTRPGRAAEA